MEHDVLTNNWKTDFKESIKDYQINKYEKLFI